MIGLNRRRAMGDALPYDAEIEYLESDGNQFIDTNYIPTGTDNEFEISFRYLGYVNIDPTNPSFAQIFYAFISSNHLMYRIIIRKSDSASNIYNGNIYNAGNLILSKNIDYIVKANSSNIIVNNVYINWAFVSGQTNTAKIRILKTDTKARIKSFKWVKGNNVMFDMIPVRVGQVGYMYDKVSGQLFGNSGTGNFILGNDVN